MISTRKWTALLFAGGALALAACGGSTTKTASNSNASSGASAATAPAASSSAKVTISATSVGSYGKVLVNGQGRTLYLLNSEKGGKVTCTASNGCTGVWPPVVLPSGTTAATAGSGVKSSLLGTVKDPTGSLQVTYGGWPLYTFVKDSAAGQANGQGINHFGGIWYVVNTSGQPITTPAASSSSASSTTSSGYGSGY